MFEDVPLVYRRPKVSSRAGSIASAMEFLAFWQTICTTISEMLSAWKDKHSHDQNPEHCV